MYGPGHDLIATRGGPRSLAAILESFPALIAYVDADLVYRFTNHVYERELNRTQEQLTGRTVAEVLGPEAFAVSEPHLRRALAGELHSYEAEFRFPGRDPCWLVVHYIPDRGPSGTVLGLHVFALDITRRKLAETDLRRSEERYRILFDHSPVGIGHYDRQGRLQSMNRRGCQELDRDEAALLGKTLPDIFGEEVARPFTARFERILATGLPEEHLDEVVLPTGRKWFLSTYAPVRDPDGSLTGIQVVSNDITEHKRTQQEARELEIGLQQAQKMQAVGTLAGGVAHDFNNILQTVLGFVESIAGGECLCQEHREDLEVIGEACRRGGSLTGQLLAFSRQQLLAPEVLAANEVVVSVIKMIRRLIGEGIELVVDLDADRDSIFADAGQMTQILLNLAVNARDAMAGSGRLTVRTGTRRVAAGDCLGKPGLKPGDYVAISVADTGMGMSPELAARIFEPFFTTKELGRGTGLGLATVFGIVKQHDGYIDVATTPGAGATFTVLLPLHRGGAMTAAPAPVHRLAGGRETILLAEDDPGVLIAVTRILEKAGYRVFAASNGPEALALHRELAAEIDLAVLDVVMPGCSGGQVHDLLTESSPGLRTLFISGYPLDGGSGLPAWDRTMPLLRKPFNSAELLAAVREALAVGCPPA